MRRRLPVVSVGRIKKPQLRLRNCGPGTDLRPRRHLWFRLRVASDPILRTAGPPAHTHVPGDGGVAHGGGSMGQRPVPWQARVPLRPTSTAATIPSSARSGRPSSERSATRSRRASRPTGPCRRRRTTRATASAWPMSSRPVGIGGSRTPGTGREATCSPRTPARAGRRIALCATARRVPRSPARTPLFASRHSRSSGRSAASASSSERTQDSRSPKACAWSSQRRTSWVGESEVSMTLSRRSAVMTATRGRRRRWPFGSVLRTCACLPSSHGRTRLRLVGGPARPHRCC